MENVYPILKEMMILLLVVPEHFLTHNKENVCHAQTVVSSVGIVILVMNVIQILIMIPILNYALKCVEMERNM